MEHRGKLQGTHMGRELSSMAVGGMELWAQLMIWQSLVGKIPFKSLYYSQLGIRNKVNFLMLSYKQICITVFERRQSKTCVFKASSSTVYLHIRGS